MSVCSCKTKCATNRRKCRKNDSQNTDVWKCVDCENDDAQDAFDGRLEYVINEDENRCLE